MKKILLLIAFFVAFGAQAHVELAEASGGHTNSEGGSHEKGAESVSGPIEYERESTFQLGIDGGYDSYAKKNLVAFSAAIPLGESGFKIVAEYSAGRHGDVGANVTILKGVKELLSFGRFELGAVLGVGHSVEADVAGNGWIAGGEVAYDLSKLYSLKLEATRFTGTGVLSDERSNVIQSGLIIKF
jgi:hypothetical protein